MTIEECRAIIKARPKWQDAFQRYCNDVMNSYDGSVYGMCCCGYCDYCDYCDDEEMDDNGCSKALERYLYEHDKKGIDYRNTTHKYFRKFVIGDME